MRHLKDWSLGRRWGLRQQVVLRLLLQQQASRACNANAEWVAFSAAAASSRWRALMDSSLHWSGPAGRWAHRGQGHMSIVGRLLESLRTSLTGLQNQLDRRRGSRGGGGQAGRRQQQQRRSGDRLQASSPTQSGRWELGSLRRRSPAPLPGCVRRPCQGELWVSVLHLQDSDCAVF